MTPQRLTELLRYDPDAGRFYWTERASSEFMSAEYAAYWNRRYAGKETLTVVRPDGRIQRKIDGHRLYAHRIAWALFYGEWPKADIDHINGDPGDNRISNLRVVTRAENQKNRPMPKTNKSGVCGVSFDNARMKWRADIRDGGKRVALGRFGCVTAATVARKLAEIERGYHPNHGRPQC